MQNISSLLSGCILCSVQNSGTTVFFTQIHSDLPHFLSVPGIPASVILLQDLVPLGLRGAHVLLVPKRHCISLAQAENHREVEISARILVRQLHYFFPSNSIFYFEHGAGYIESKPVACGGCHVDHAHGHVIVLPGSWTLAGFQEQIEAELKNFGWKQFKSKVKLKGIFQNLKSCTGRLPYLYFGMAQNNTEADAVLIPHADDSLAIPSQLLRKIISVVVYGRNESQFWHWKDIVSGISDDERVRMIQQEVLRFRRITGW